MICLEAVIQKSTAQSWLPRSHCLFKRDRERQTSDQWLKVSENDILVKARTWKEGTQRGIEWRAVVEWIIGVMYFESGICMMILSY